MKTTAVAMLFFSSVSFAQAPADAPVLDATTVPIPDGSIRLAPDEPGVSVHVLVGQLAPFTGRLIADEENKRRAQKEADLAATLADAQGNAVLLPKPAVAAMIVAGVAMLGTIIGLSVAVASKK